MASQYPSCSVPTEVEQHLVATLLPNEAGAQYSAGDIAAGHLAPAVRILGQLSANYNEHDVGQKLAHPISSLEAAKAYALYYLPINAAKILHLVRLGMCLPANARVLDFGSGPGTAGMALLASLSVHLDLHCVENSSWMRTVADTLLRSFRGQGTLASLQQSSAIDAIAKQKFDLVIASNAFAELSSSERTATRKALADCVAPNGYLLIVEPGQKVHTRTLMMERDLFLSEYPDFAPTYPCFRQDPCPMLKASEEDWCHGTLTFDRGALTRQLDQLLGFNKHRIKFAAFAFQRNGSLQPGYRMITAPEKGPRGVEAIVCGADYYGVVRIGKRARSELNRAFEKARIHGQVVSSASLSEQITRDTVVAIASPEGSPNDD